MRTSRAWMLCALALAGCAEEAPTDTETDVEETDTEPPEVDASNYEIHPNAPQTFEAVLPTGENDIDLDFSMNLEHKVTPVLGFDFRNFIGAIERDNPFAETPPTVTLVLRALVREDIIEPGTYDCAGEGGFGLTLELYARSAQLPERVWTTARITDEDNLSCEMVITKITNERFVATIERAPMLPKEGATAFIEDITLDLVMREIEGE